MHLLFTADFPSRKRRRPVLKGRHRPFPIAIHNGYYYCGAHARTPPGLCTPCYRTRKSQKEPTFAQEVSCGWENKNEKAMPDGKSTARWTPFLAVNFKVTESQVEASIQPNQPILQALQRMEGPAPPQAHASYERQPVLPSLVGREGRTSLATTRVVI